MVLSRRGLVPEARLPAARETLHVCEGVAGAGERAREKALALGEQPQAPREEALGPAVRDWSCQMSAPLSDLLSVQWYELGPPGVVYSGTAVITPCESQPQTCGVTHAGLVVLAPDLDDADDVAVGVQLGLGLRQTCEDSLGGGGSVGGHDK